MQPSYQIYIKTFFPLPKHEIQVLVDMKTLSAEKFDLFYACNSGKILICKNLKIFFQREHMGLGGVRHLLPLFKLVAKRHGLLLKIS